MAEVKACQQSEERASFSFYNPPVGRVNYVKEADLYGIYRYIVEPKYAKRQTDTLRTIISDEERKRYKANNFAYCLFSGTFGVDRKNDGLQLHSGLLCLDFDHLNQVVFTDNARLDEVRRILINDPYFETLLLFVSPSGNGLKWVIPIDLEKATHEQWYTGVSNYIRATYGLQADPACKNVARACFLPHDPDCYIAPRLHREIAHTIEVNPAVEDLMVSLGATNIKIENNEQAE